MEKLENNKDKSARQKEKDARIVRDDPQPVSIGNGVHREDSKLAQKEANDETVKRAKIKE